MNIQQLREAAKYTETFQEEIWIRVMPEGIQVTAGIEAVCISRIRSWAELDSTRQTNPITYLIDQTVKELTAAARGLEG